MIDHVHRFAQYTKRKNKKQIGFCRNTASICNIHVLDALK